MRAIDEFQLEPLPGRSGLWVPIIKPVDFLIVKILSSRQCPLKRRFSRSERSIWTIFVG